FDFILSLCHTCYSRHSTALVTHRTENGEFGYDRLLFISINFRTINNNKQSVPVRRLSLLFRF
ncbi:MAG: hypothetical protein OXE94_03230, partial [Aestuariivita sp.]|nr:hypothetical protein [Aestuariivita sp.]MCY4201231.1 hypothetical protein [Aestuariivita sp.]